MPLSNTSTGSVTSGKRTDNNIQMDLIFYLVIPMCVGVVLVLMIAGCVLCARKKRKSDEKPDLRPESQIYLAADIPSPTTLSFEMMDLPPLPLSARSTVMEGRRLPSEPILHEYTDADSGHYEALPALDMRDEHGYLILYDDAPRHNDTQGYLVPSRLSATQEDLYTFADDDPRTRSPVTFRRADYESTLGRNAPRRTSRKASTLSTGDPTRRTL